MTLRASKRRKPLILRGARQVGKTSSAKQVGNASFDNVAIVDLERNPDWHRVFDGNLDPNRIVAELEILAGERIRPGKTLLFIDEIRVCPRAMTALRYFHRQYTRCSVRTSVGIFSY